MSRRLVLIISCIGLLAVVAVIFWWIESKPQRYFGFSKTDVAITCNADDFVYGSDTAPLTVYMFATYNCRHCRNFLALDLPYIQQHYTDSGRLRLVVKPIEPAENPDMMSALQLAACMNRDGNADDILKLLLSEPSAVYTDEFRQLIDDIINNNEELAECLTADNFSGIKQNNSDFFALKSKVTPIFVIDKHLYKGRRKLDQFLEVLDYELNIVK